MKKTCIHTVQGFLNISYTIRSLCNSVWYYRKLFLYFHVANEALYYQCEPIKPEPKEITEEVKNFNQLQSPKIKTTDSLNISSENRTLNYKETDFRTECSDRKKCNNMGTSIFPIHEHLSQSLHRCYLNFNNDYAHVCALEQTDDITESNSTSQCNKNDYTLQHMSIACSRNAPDHPLYTVEHDDLSRAHGSTPLSSLHKRGTTTIHTSSTSHDTSSVTSQGNVALDRIFSSSVWFSDGLQHVQTSADRRVKGKCRIYLGYCAFDILRKVFLFLGFTQKQICKLLS